MTESLNRREVLKAAWAEYWADDETQPPINHYFESGFDAAWDALLSEIAQPIKNNLLTLCVPSMTDVESLHNDAIDRLRELVKDLEGSE